MTPINDSNNYKRSGWDVWDDEGKVGGNRVKSLMPFYWLIFWSYGSFCLLLADEAKKAVD